MMLKHAVKKVVSSLCHCLKAGNNTGIRKGTFRILLYHSVDALIENDILGLAVDVANFYEQMQYLSDNGYQVMALGEIMNYIKKRIPIPPKTLSITFDDGYKGVYSYGVPILYKFNFPATVFIASDYIDAKAKPRNYWEQWEYLNWDEVKQLKDHRMSVGSHTLSHRPLEELTHSELIKELKDSKKRLEEVMGDEILFFSYPHGSVNEKIKEEVKRSGYQYACSSEIGLNDFASDLFTLKRTEITAHDSLFDFRKKICGSYDWIARLKPDRG